MGIPFGDSPLILLVPRTYFLWDSYWNFPVGASELIPFVACSDRFCYSRSVEIPSRVFLLVFPRMGFTLIVSSQGTKFPPVGGLLFFSFIWELHTTERYGEGKWASDLVQFLVGYTQPPLVLMPWHIFLIWLCI